jgi:hypothetical protein
MFPRRLLVFGVLAAGGAAWFPGEARAFCGFFVAGSDASRARVQTFTGPQPSWVLTRLHARYDKDSLSEDLVFREAPPVIGGRADWGGGNSEANAGAQVMRDAGADNNFQGRYIIRHYWTGAVACESPRFEMWGGPPDNPYGGGNAQAAKGLATAPRGRVALKTEVRSPVPLLGIPGKPPVRRKPAP